MNSVSIPTFLRRWLPLGLLLLFAAFSVWYWLYLNVVPYGRDAGGHLATSLEYRPFLTTPSPRTLFQVLRLNGYRPPVLYLSTLPFYALFGVSMDSAVYANIAWLLLGVLGCYALGRHLAGHRAGVVAALVYLCFPFVHGVARLFYFETALTAFVAWYLVALLKADGWRNRRWSLLWGVILGFGLLTKWTLPATVGIPSLYILWRQWWMHRSVTPLTKNLESPPQARWRTPLILLPLSLVGGTILALLFLAPNHDLLPTTLLGYWLYPLLALTWGITIFAVLRPPNPLSNLIVGLLVALSIMAFWYYLQPGFIRSFVDAAYLGAEGRDEPVNFLRLRTYTYYLTYFVTELAGPLLALLLVIPLLAPFVSLARRRRWPDGWHGDTAVVLWLALSSTYVAFSLASYNSERSMLALLLPLAVLVGGVLMPTRNISFVLTPRLALSIGVAIVGVGILQWATITLPIASSYWATMPAYIASGEFLQPPTAGTTDARYWVAPDVLNTVTTDNDAPTSFGMLVNTEGIHRGPFRYLIEAQNLAVELDPLTEKDAKWGDIFANEWVLVKDGVNDDVEIGGLEAIQRITQGDELFDLFYDPVKSYPLPDNETVTLWHRELGPAFPAAATDWQATTQPIVQAINETWMNDAQLLLPDAETGTWLASDTITATHAAWIEGIPPDPQASTLLVVVTPSQDPRSVFDQVYYHARTLDTERASLVIYGQPQQPLVQVPLSAEWNTFAISDLRTLPTVAAGDVIPLDIQLSGELPAAHNVSLRLIDSNGTVLAQIDKPLAPQIKAGLLVPKSTPQGNYEVVVLIYDVATFAPLSDTVGISPTSLLSVAVTAP